MAVLRNQLKMMTLVHQMKSIPKYTNASATKPRYVYTDAKLQVSHIDTALSLPS